MGARRLSNQREGLLNIRTEAGLIRLYPDWRAEALVAGYHQRP